MVTTFKYDHRRDPNVLQRYHLGTTKGLFVPVIMRCSPPMSIEGLHRPPLAFEVRRG